MSDIQQNTPEWMQSRCGKATASRISDIVAKTKTGYSTSRAKYMAQLVVERITGQVAESYQNSAMLYGIETEPLARAAFEAKVGVLVDEVGSIDHPTIAMSSASPDGLVGDDSLIEIKCPMTHTHIETLVDGSISKDYIDQMQWQMACTGRQFCYFVSYDNRMPNGLQLFIKRIPRDNSYIDELEKEVTKFLDEVSIKVDKLMKLKE